MVSAGARTPDYGHTPARLVNGQAELALPRKTRCIFKSNGAPIKHAALLTIERSA